MATIALIFGVPLALLVALLAVPLTVVFSINRIEGMKGYVRFRWLFGLIRFQVRIPQADKDELQPEVIPKKKQKSRKRTKRHDIYGIIALLRRSAFRGHVYKFLHGILRAVHARDLFLRMRIGLSDPADTGRLWAVLGPVAGFMQNIQSADVHLEPEFVDLTFEVEGHGRLDLVPIQFIVSMMVFILSPWTLRIWRASRQEDA